MNLGLGWKRSPASAPRRFGAGIRFAEGDLPTARALVVPGGFPLNQGNTQTCVPHSAAACLRILTGLPLAARLLMYGNARLRDGETATSLTDDGCVPSHLVAALAEDGVCLESDWPFDESKVNVAPPWNALRIASAYRVTGFERLPDDGTRIVALKRTLVAGHPIMFGGPVSDDYANLPARKVWTGPSGQILGDHMQTIVGFDDAIAAARVLNSWDTWCDGGYAWVSYDWLQNQDVTDFYGLTVGPTVMT